MPELSRRALSPRSTEAWSSPEDDFEAVALGVQAFGMETSRSFIWSPRVPVACVVVHFITFCFSLDLRTEPGRIAGRFHVGRPPLPEASGCLRWASSRQSGRSERESLQLLGVTQGQMGEMTPSSAPEDCLSTIPSASFQPIQKYPPTAHGSCRIMRPMKTPTQACPMGGGQGGGTVAFGEPIAAIDVAL